MRASHHGVDQRFRDADVSTASPELLRPAASIGGAFGPMAEAGARFL